MWWVVFCEVIPHILTVWFPVDEEIVLFYPVLHAIKLHINCLGIFCLTVAVMIPLAVELYVLVGVGGWGKPILLRLMHRGTAV